MKQMLLDITVAASLSPGISSAVNPAILAAKHADVNEGATDNSKILVPNPFSTPF